MTKAGVEELQKEKPLLNVQHSYDDELFGGATLNSPEIVATSTLFSDTVHVRLKGAFKGASMFYTLDGTTPDSTSFLYVDSIVVNSSITLNAFCYKKGWKSSEIESQSFRKSGLALKAIQLSQKPDDGYKGKGGTTLMDFEHGTEDIKDGRWLGYQGAHFTLVAELDSLQEISTAGLSAMSSPGPWIFFPKGLKVWTSENGKQYKLAAETRYDIEQEGNYRESKYFDLNFEPRKARFVKMQVTSQLKNPSWHPTPGGASWLFMDEVSVE